MSTNNELFWDNLESVMKLIESNSVLHNKDGRSGKLSFEGNNLVIDVPEGKVEYGPDIQFEQLVKDGWLFDFIEG